MSLMLLRTASQKAACSSWSNAAARPGLVEFASRPHWHLVAGAALDREWLATRDARLAPLMAALEAAFAGAALHPSELKPAVTKAVDAVLERVRKGVQADAELVKAEKLMANAHKRMTAKK